MAGGARATTATTAGPSAPKSTDGTVDFQSEVDANSLYQLLENQIIPLYYAKPDGKLPLAWLQLMRESIRSITPVFNTHRMVKEYTERLYIPAAKAHRGIRPAMAARPRQAQQMESADAQRLAASEDPRCSGRQQGSPEYSGGRSAADFRESSSRRRRSEPCSRRSLPRRKPTTAEFRNPTVTVLDESSPAEGEGNYIYQGSVPASDSGTYGFSVRVVPVHPHLMQTHELRLITWS